MNRETQHNQLAQLGEELLREFEETQTTEVSVDFDRKCRDTFFWKRDTAVCRFTRWTAWAAVTVLAVIGLFSVTVMSVGTLRGEFIRLMVERSDREPEETVTEYRQISSAKTDNTTVTVYYDGEENYQILLSDEYGQRVYDFSSYGMDEEFVKSLGARLAAAEE